MLKQILNIILIWQLGLGMGIPVSINTDIDDIEISRELKTELISVLNRINDQSKVALATDVDISEETDILDSENDLISDIRIYLSQAISIPEEEIQFVRIDKTNPLDDVTGPTAEELTDVYIFQAGASEIEYIDEGNFSIRTEGPSVLDSLGDEISESDQVDAVNIIDTELGELVEIVVSDSAPIITDGDGESTANLANDVIAAEVNEVDVDNHDNTSINDAVDDLLAAATVNADITISADIIDIITTSNGTENALSTTNNDRVNDLSISEANIIDNEDSGISQVVHEETTVIPMGGVDVNASDASGQSPVTPLEITTDVLEPFINEFNSSWEIIENINDYRNLGAYEPFFPLIGTTIVGDVVDNGDGTYSVEVELPDTNYRFRGNATYTLRELAGGGFEVIHIEASNGSEFQIYDEGDYRVVDAAISFNSTDRIKTYYNADGIRVKKTGTRFIVSQSEWNIGLQWKLQDWSQDYRFHSGWDWEINFDDQGIFPTDYTLSYKIHRFHMDELSGDKANCPECNDNNLVFEQQITVDYGHSGLPAEKIYTEKFYLPNRTIDKSTTLTYDPSTSPPYRLQHVLEERREQFFDDFGNVIKDIQFTGEEFYSGNAVLDNIERVEVYTTDEVTVTTTELRTIKSKIDSKQSHMVFQGDFNAVVNAVFQLDNGAIKGVVYTDNFGNRLEPFNIFDTAVVFDPFDTDRLVETYLHTFKSNQLINQLDLESQISSKLGLPNEDIFFEKITFDDNGGAQIRVGLLRPSLSLDCDASKSCASRILGNRDSEKDFQAAFVFEVDDYRSALGLDDLTLTEVFFPHTLTGRFKWGIPVERWLQSGADTGEIILHDPDEIARAFRSSVRLGNFAFTDYGMDSNAVWANFKIAGYNIRYSYDFENFETSINHDMSTPLEITTDVLEPFINEFNSSWEIIENINDYRNLGAYEPFFPLIGTTIVGDVVDNGDGTYSVEVELPDTNYRFRGNATYTLRELAGGGFEVIHIEASNGSEFQIYDEGDYRVVDAAISFNSTDRIKTYYNADGIRVKKTGTRFIVSQSEWNIGLQWKLQDWSQDYRFHSGWDWEINFDDQGIFPTDYTLSYKIHRFHMDELSGDKANCPECNDNNLVFEQQITVDYGHSGLPAEKIYTEKFYLPNRTIDKSTTLTYDPSTSPPYRLQHVLEERREQFFDDFGNVIKDIQFTGEEFYSGNAVLDNIERVEVYTTDEVTVTTTELRNENNHIISKQSLMEFRGAVSSTVNAIYQYNHHQQVIGIAFRDNLGNQFEVARSFDTIFNTDVLVDMYLGALLSGTNINLEERLTSFIDMHFHDGAYFVVKDSLGGLFRNIVHAYSVLSVQEVGSGVYDVLVTFNDRNENYRPEITYTIDLNGSEPRLVNIAYKGSEHYQERDFDYQVFDPSAFPVIGMNSIILNIDDIVPNNMDLHATYIKDFDIHIDATMLGEDDRSFFVREGDAIKPCQYISMSECHQLDLGVSVVKGNDLVYEKNVLLTTAIDMISGNRVVGAGVEEADIYHDEPSDGLYTSRYYEYFENYEYHLIDDPDARDHHEVRYVSSDMSMQTQYTWDLDHAVGRARIAEITLTRNYYAYDASQPNNHRKVGENTIVVNRVERVVGSVYTIVNDDEVHTITSYVPLFSIANPTTKRDIRVSDIDGFVERIVEYDDDSLDFIVRHVHDEDDDIVDRTQVISKTNSEVLLDFEGYMIVYDAKDWYDNNLVHASSDQNLAFIDNRNAVLDRQSSFINNDFFTAENPDELTLESANP